MIVWEGGVIKKEWSRLSALSLLTLSCNFLRNTLLRITASIMWPTLIIAMPFDPITAGLLHLIFLPLAVLDAFIGPIDQRLAGVHLSVLFFSLEYDLRL